MPPTNNWVSATKTWVRPFPIVNEMSFVIFQLWKTHLVATKFFHGTRKYRLTSNRNRNVHDWCCILWIGCNQIKKRWKRMDKSRRWEQVKDECYERIKVRVVSQLKDRKQRRGRGEKTQRFSCSFETKRGNVFWIYFSVLFFLCFRSFVSDDSRKCIKYAIANKFKSNQWKIHKSMNWQLIAPATLGRAKWQTFHILKKKKKVQETTTDSNQSNEHRQNYFTLLFLVKLHDFARNHVVFIFSLCKFCSICRRRCTTHVFFFTLLCFFVFAQFTVDEKCNIFHAS